MKHLIINLICLSVISYTFASVMGLSGIAHLPLPPFLYPEVLGVEGVANNIVWFLLSALRLDAVAAQNTRDRAQRLGPARSLVGHASHPLPARPFLSRFGPVGRVWPPLGSMQAHRWNFVGLVTLRDPTTRPHGVSEDPVSMQFEPTGQRTTCGGRSTCLS